MATGTIIINDDLRTMQIPSSITLLGVESDDDVNVLQFQMPKEYNGFDLSTFQARINYMNANGVGDVYIADDLAVDGDDMTFSWLVGRTACAYVGNVQFIVCLKKFDENDNVVQEFNTTVYTLPVLRGLETTEAVVQQNPDIIEHILKLIEQAGIIDFSDYYTKAETDALKLPNPQKLTINGIEYDGSQPIEMTVSADTDELTTVSGQIIHVVDAVALQAVNSLTAFDDENQPLASATVCVANKNLFRIDLLPATLTSKGLTFTKTDDGAIEVTGTSTGTYPMTSCEIDPHIFAVGNTYTLSSGKTAGFTYVQLIINYADSSTDYIVARNSARSFTISKAVSSVTGSVQLTDSGVTVNETVYPQLELSATASVFVMNQYSEMQYTGSVMPVLPSSISNVWSSDDEVAVLTMEYEADTVMTKVNAFINANILSSLTAESDGNGTITMIVR